MYFTYYRTHPILLQETNLYMFSLKSHIQVPNVVIAKLYPIPSSQSISYHFMPYTFSSSYVQPSPIAHTRVCIHN